VAEKPRDTAVNFDTYRNLQRHRTVFPAIALHGSCFTVWFELQWSLYCRLTAESACEIILKLVNICCGLQLWRTRRNLGGWLVWSTRGIPD